MLVLNIIEKSSYHIINDEHMNDINNILIIEPNKKAIIPISKGNYNTNACRIFDIPHNFNYISECSDPRCVYTRKKTNMRERFENKILKRAQKKHNIKILFFGSFLLLQELKILLLINDRVSEVHLTDYAYQNFLYKNDNSYIMAFKEFIEFIKKQKWNINVYVHSDPEELKNSIMFQRRFDIICGIDIDYSKGKLDNRPIMKMIAENTLKIDGIMYVSQHNLDQVDLCQYRIENNGKIKLINAEYFVKKEYYVKYMLQNLFYKLYHTFSFTGLFFSTLFLKKSPFTSLMVGTYCTIDIFYRYLTKGDNSRDFEININSFYSLQKK